MKDIRVDQRADFPAGGTDSAEGSNWHWSVKKICANQRDLFPTDYRR